MRWLAVLLALGGCDLVFEINTPGPPGEVTFAQANAGDVDGSEVAVAFLVPTQHGNLIVVGVDWTGDVALASLTTSTNDPLIPVAAPSDSNGLRAVIYYAADITGGPCTVTARLDGPASSLELYIHEYAGIDTVDPLDGAAANIGGDTAMSSGSAQLSRGGDLVFAFAVDGQVMAGEGFTARSTFNGNLVEDMISGAPGPYGATATANSFWVFQMAAFRAASKQ
jgi:hypothetical protein